MTARGYDRGIPVEYKDKAWRYTDTGIPINLNDFADEMNRQTAQEKPRACPKCKEQSTEEGHDFCLRNLPGVLFACCGHGKKGYITFENGISIRGKFKVERAGCNE